MDTAHLHRWNVASTHQTSEGTVVYHRCRCGRLRITQLALDHQPRRLR